MSLDQFDPCGGGSLLPLFFGQSSDGAKPALSQGMKDQTANPAHSLSGTWASMPREECLGTTMLSSRMNLP